jgi:hypothetical protein
LCRGAAGGSWSTLATAEADLTCCVSVGEVLYIGTDDARLLRLARTVSFSRSTVRCDRRALVDGQLLGPALGIRSITATSDGAVLLANVPVAGSADTGCIATNRAAVAIADKSGSVYVSADAGHGWSRWGGGLPSPSGVLIA